MSTTVEVCLFGNRKAIIVVPDGVFITLRALQNKIRH